MWTGRVWTAQEAEEIATKVRMALAEAGFPDPSLIYTRTGLFNYVGFDTIRLPAEVAWQAAWVCGYGAICLSCFSAADAGVNESKVAHCRASAPSDLDCGIRWRQGITGAWLVSTEP